MKRFHANHPTASPSITPLVGSLKAAPERCEGTWITRDIITAYHQLHELGAHSIEVWEGGALVGGMYGVAQGTLFCGESMFSRAVNASKTALLVFCEAFAQRGGRLIDCQVLNEHTASLGAVEIPRRQYIEHWMPAVRRSSARLLDTENALYAQCLNVFRIFFVRVL
jgi:leucyl/phenylalanyl-tRNA--protein transferase